MAQILVAKDLHWYQGIASYRNYSEKKLEDRMQAHAEQIFEEYFSFVSGYTFTSKANEKSDPDLILIAKDLSQWVIVELELVGKDLTHTKKQLRVFTDINLDVDAFVKHCIGKERALSGKESELNALFTNKAPEVLVVFDSYHTATLNTISSEFACRICVFEIYKTISHDFELYRMSGDYPYVYTKFCFLKQFTTAKEHYTIQRPTIFDGVARGQLDIYHRTYAIKAILTEVRGDLYLKIPGKNFPPSDVLKIFRTSNNRFVIEKL